MKRMSGGANTDNATEPYASWDPDEEPGTARMVCQRTMDQGATWEEVERSRGRVCHSVLILI
jgi:hypothetical protein